MSHKLLKPFKASLECFHEQHPASKEMLLHKPQLLIVDEQQDTPSED